MASFNRVIMMGNLTRDPEHKTQQSGQAVCRLSLASNRQYRNKQTGLMVQEVCYVDVDVWGVQADNCRQYLQKGRPILVEGRLKFDTWESEGQIKRRHSIVADRVVFLGSNQQSDGMSDNQFDESSFSDQSDVKQKKAVTAKSKKSFEGDSSKEVFFKDEAPFEDDLPF